MMAVALLLALQDAASASQAPEELVVFGQRMRKLRFRTQRDRKTGAMKCRVLRSSGDVELDRIACDVGNLCATSINKDDERALVACFEPKLAAGWDALVAQRRAAREKTGKDAKN